MLVWTGTIRITDTDLCCRFSVFQCMLTSPSALNPSYDSIPAHLPSPSHWFHRYTPDPYTNLGQWAGSPDGSQSPAESLRKPSSGQPGAFETGMTRDKYFFLLVERKQIFIDFHSLNKLLYISRQFVCHFFLCFATSFPIICFDTNIDLELWLGAGGAHDNRRAVGQQIFQDVGFGQAINAGEIVQSLFNGFARTEELSVRSHRRRHNDDSRQNDGNTQHFPHCNLFFQKGSGNK